STPIIKDAEATRKPHRPGHFWRRPPLSIISRRRTSSRSRITAIFSPPGGADKAVEKPRLLHMRTTHLLSLSALRIRAHPALRYSNCFGRSAAQHVSSKPHAVQNRHIGAQIRPTANLAHRHLKAGGRHKN